MNLVIKSALVFNDTILHYHTKHFYNQERFRKISSLSERPSLLAADKDVYDM